MPDEQDSGTAGSMPIVPATAPAPSGQIQPMSQEIALQIVRNQEREYDIREKEVALEQLKQANAFSYSEKALDKQSSF